MSNITYMHVAHICTHSYADLPLLRENLFEYTVAQTSVTTFSCFVFKMFKEYE